MELLVAFWYPQVCRSSLGHCFLMCDHKGNLWDCFWLTVQHIEDNHSYSSCVPCSASRHLICIHAARHVGCQQVWCQDLMGQVCPRSTYITARKDLPFVLSTSGLQHAHLWVSHVPWRNGWNAEWCCQRPHWPPCTDADEQAEACKTKVIRWHVKQHNPKIS